MVTATVPRGVSGARTAALVLALSMLASCNGPDRERPRRTRQPTTTYSFSILDGSLPRVLFMHREREANLVLRNDGFNSWDGDRTFFFSPRWFGVRGGQLLDEGFRTPLPHSVAPGEEVRFTVRVRPPERYGLFRVQWDLLSDKSGWFQRFDRTPEPQRWVLILPPVGFLLAALLPCLILGAAVAARTWPEVIGARLSKSYLDSFALAWCAASLLGKPYVLYVELAPKFWPGPKLVTFSVVALLLLPTCLLRGTAKKIALWLLAALGAFEVWAQVNYYRFFLDLASSVVALAAGQATDLGESVGYLASSTDVWLAVDLLLALPVLFWASNEAERPARRRRLAVAMALAILAIPFLWTGAKALAAGQLHGRRNLQNLRSVSVYGLYGFQLLDAGARVLGDWTRPEPTPEEIDLVVEWFEETRHHRAATAPAAGLARGLNLIAIQVESMQEFVVDLEVDGVPVMPNLRRLRRNALEFPLVMDQTSRGRSSAGDFVAMTSLIPIGESIAYEFPENDYYTIGRALSEHSYATLSAIPYKGSFWNRQVTHPAYGFQTNLFRSAFEREGPRVGWGLNDRDFFRQMIPILESLEEPFFAWLTTLSVHYPYESFPEELKERSMGDLEGTRLGNYLHGMHFFDRALGELFASLKSKGLSESTVVTLWGDHGSGLIRDRQFLEYFGLNSSARRFAFDRVPFLVWLPPDRETSGVRPVPAGQVDIAPTLLALMGLDPANVALMGRNLLQDRVGGRIVHPQGKWLDSDLVFLSQFADTDGACWSAKTLRPVPPRLCEKGTLDAERQLEVVSLVLEHDLQAEVTRRLAQSADED